ncbi:uncharacterized protein LOC115973375 [Quercus lobata]|uniref:uncharacterized protein LOC115973375 n=1 Tax=Quercus lobata TaxID=97700 RepID=UPI001245B91D|nr:uncharacterized protein LOC115973375 [Quercus lobata]
MIHILFNFSTLMNYCSKILKALALLNHQVLQPLSTLLLIIGDVWHVFLKGDFKHMLYGYKFDGKFSPDEGLYYDSSRILLDPYAKAVISRGEFGALGADGNCWPQMACMEPSFDDEVLQKLLKDDAISKARINTEDRRDYMDDYHVSFILFSTYFYCQIEVKYLIAEKLCCFKKLQAC